MLRYFVYAYAHVMRMPVHMRRHTCVMRIYAYIYINVVNVNQMIGIMIGSIVLCGVIYFLLHRF